MYNHDMNAKALKTLEFDKITDLLAQQATSDAGRELCRNLVPLADTMEKEFDINILKNKNKEN